MESVFFESKGEFSSWTICSNYNLQRGKAVTGSSAKGEAHSGIAQIGFAEA